MKTETLVHFQYQTVATSFLVRATVFSELENSPDKIMVTIINGEEVTRSTPKTRGQAVNEADAAIAAFLRDVMVPVYLGDD